MRLRITETWRETRHDAGFSRRDGGGFGDLPRCETPGDCRLMKVWRGERAALARCARVRGGRMAGRKMRENSAEFKITLTAFVEGFYGQGAGGNEVFKSLNFSRGFEF